MKELWQKIYWVGVVFAFSGLVLGPTTHTLEPLAFTMFVVGVSVMLIDGVYQIGADIYTVYRKRHQKQ